jgi:hypothetical protein
VMDEQRSGRPSTSADLVQVIEEVQADRTHFLFCPLFQYGRHLETSAVSVHVT